jgi:hypothetical protein
MKKTNFTNPMWMTGWLFAVTLALVTTFSVNDAAAQCSLAINDEVNISLDAFDCETEITPDMVLESPQSCPGQKIVTVTDLQGNLIPTSPYVNHEYIGQTLLVYVMHPSSGNMSQACRANIFDKMAPYITCPQDTVSIYCWQVDEYAPDAWDNCDTSSVNMIVTNEVITGNPCDGSIPLNVLRYHDRSYVAIDGSGNVSDTCEVTVEVLSATPQQLNTGLIFPESRTVLGGDPISCADDFESTVTGCCEPTGYPVPEFSGVPMLRLPHYGGGWDTIALYPNGYIPCNITVSYLDLPENPSEPGCVTTFMRMWTVTQWSCSINYIRNYAQIIEIADDNDPVVICPGDALITTNSNGVFDNTSYGTVYCGATYRFPAPDMSDLCTPTELLQWDISVANDMGHPIEFVDNADPDNPPYRLLPLGVNTITYTVYDLCGNSASCDFTVTVDDDTAPVAVCQQYTTVGLTYDGFANVFAHSFDSGSYDDCALDYIEVKRMDHGVPCELETGDGDVFKDYVTFCCADIGNPVTVILRVWDVAGNWNECMVQVEVQDKLAPVISCPDDMEVNCDFFFNPDNLDAYFGTATAYDNCNVRITQDADIDIDQCGIGSITRYFTATDDGGRTATCTQHIEFVNYDPFWINQDWPGDPNDDVIWPATYTGEGCLNPADLHPDVTGWPVLLEGPCDLVGYTYDDDVFFFNDSDADAEEACFKIIRHWKVNDWCQDIPGYNGVFATWYYDQLIMVTDTDGPTITSDCEDKTTCTYDPDCEDGYIELTMSAEDICTDGAELRWHYKIDYDWTTNNPYGSFDWDSEVLYGANVQALGELNNGYFPIGTHKIYWTVWDQCGNSTVCEYLFTIQNCKQPTPYCLDNIATTLMGMDTDGDGETDWGMVEIKAIDCAPCCLDAYHPCTYDIAISFSEDWNDNVRTFDCDDFGINTVEIWATAFLPDGSVTQDYCVTHIDIQDNLDVCANGPDQFVQIAGMVQNVEGGAIAGTTVELEGSELAPQVTDETGNYAFHAMANGNYNVIPSRDGDDAQGVTTLDLILIQKHLLALKEMDSPYTIIAADVDANGKISAADLFSIRQLILGVNDSFENTKSWAFIDGAYEFQNPANPLDEDFPVNYLLNNVTEDMNVNFIGVKMGDINHTVALSGGQDVMNRSQSLALVTDEKVYELGEVVEVPVYAENYDQISGFQLTWSFDPEVLEFSGITAGALTLNGENLGLTQLNRGYITMSYNDFEARDLSGDDALFTLNFQAVKAGKLSRDIRAGSTITPKEAYHGDLSVIDLNFETRTLEMETFELFQNTPNPFSTVTNVSFNLPEAGFAKLTISDVTGRVLKVISGDFSKGLNTIQLNKADLNTAGVLYYQLDSEGNTATRRMVVIR